MTEKRSRQSLFYFLPLYYLTKGREGVHFRQRGVHFKLFPEDNDNPKNFTKYKTALIFLQSAFLLLNHSNFLYSVNKFPDGSRWFI